MIEKIVWTFRVRKEVLRRVNEWRNSPQKIKSRKANWIGHILSRNCILKHIIKQHIAQISHGKTRKKKYAATGLPQGNDKVLNVENRSSRLHSVENSL